MHVRQHAKAQGYGHVLALNPHQQMAGKIAQVIPELYNNAVVLAQSTGVGQGGLRVHVQQHVKAEGYGRALALTRNQNMAGKIAQGLPLL